MDNLTPEQRKRNMKAICSKGSIIEQIFAKALSSKGLRFRRYSKTIPGKPDFSLKRLKIAIFCDSDFWHGKNWEQEKNRIKTNPDYWYKKIEQNIKRDNQVNNQLHADGWVVLRFWEKDIKSNLEMCISVVEKNIKIRTKIK